MADVVNPQTVDALNIANTKTVAETNAAANANLAHIVSQSLAIAAQDLVAASARRNNMADLAMAKALKVSNELDMSEAVAVQKTATGNDLAQQLGQLLAMLNSGQQGNKSAGTTPPITVDNSKPQ